MVAGLTGADGHLARGMVFFPEAPEPPDQFFMHGDFPWSSSTLYSITQESNAQTSNAA